LSDLDWMNNTQALRRELDRLERIVAPYISRGDAEDVAAETVAVMCQRICANVHLDDPRAYANKVALNRARSEQRRQMRMGGVARSDEALVEGVDEELATDGGPYLDALLRLSRPQRVAIYLRYYEGLTTAEIAEVLGIKPSAVTSRIHRGVKALEVLLGERNPP
jgi:RNA polymerase sigma-70 factor (ECF subfamily)